MCIKVYSVVVRYSEENDSLQRDVREVCYLLWAHHKVPLETFWLATKNSFEGDVKTIHALRLLWTHEWSSVRLWLW